MFDYVAPSDLNAPAVFECLTSTRYKQPSWQIPLPSIAEKHLLTMEPEELDNDWKLNEFFENIVVINLPRSKDRLASITEELRSIGTQSFNRFDAIDGRAELEPFIWQKFFSNRENYDPETEEGRVALDSLHKGEAGCYMSHYAVLKAVAEAFAKAKIKLEEAKKSRNVTTIDHAEKQVRHYSRILILEDDSAFGVLEGPQISKEGAGTVLRQAIQELPMDWDMLYLVARATEPTEEVGLHLRKIRCSWNASAYAVNHSMYKPLLKQLKKIENPHIFRVQPVDNAISSIHHLHKVYAIYPSIVVQLNGVSEISLNMRDEMCQGQPTIEH